MCLSINSSYLHQHFQPSNHEKHGKQPKSANASTSPLETGNPASGWAGSGFVEVSTKELNIFTLTTLLHLNEQVQAQPHTEKNITAPCSLL